MTSKKKLERNREYQRIQKEQNPAKVREESKLRMREWRNKNPESIRKGNLKYSYGLTVSQFELIREHQKDKCAVFLNPFKGKRICVDHCHNTGLVRGLLCSKCNTVEGFMKTPETVKRLLEYMLKNELFYKGSM